MTESHYPESVLISGHDVYLATPQKPPSCRFVGRDRELMYCKAAWCVDSKTNRLWTEGTALSFRLEGPPGVGKNELVYEVARQLQLPLYSMQGHEEITPEDMALLLVPDSRRSMSNAMSLVLRASPLATAIHQGGLFFFDEINRVPDRALAQLASVLDGRQQISSALTGIAIGPKDGQARRSFRFCCATNPGLRDSGQVLPDYIHERTLPVIRLDYPEPRDLMTILGENRTCSREFLDAFVAVHMERQVVQMSVRQALTIMTFAMNYHRSNGGSAKEAVTTAFDINPGQ